MVILSIIKKKIRYYHKLREWKQSGIMIAPYVDCNNVEFEEKVNVAHHAELADCKIGKRTSVGRYTKIRNAEIGRYCSISWDVSIGAMGHPMDAVSTHAFTFRKKFGLCDKDYYMRHEKVIIGNDVWIGCNVVIMPGIKIEDGAVIGSGGIVTKNVKPYEIVAGIPAKHIRFRFTDEIICRLLQLKWWEWDDKLIKENISLFSYQINLKKDIDVLNKLELILKNNKNENYKTVSDC
jgi:hypothetical protein